MDLWLIFFTGLTVGGLTCLAVQGGLLASTIAVREEEDLEEGGKRKHNLFPVLAFLAAKFISYTILGFTLGAFGSVMSLSDTTRIVIQLLAGVYMVVVALNLLNVHPIFRYAIIQPPRFLTRLVRNTSKSKDLFAPAFLGLLTIFIPCGTTLAMEALAISTGNPFLGAGVMAVFVLGTSPLFFILGFLTTTLGDAFRVRFFKIAGVLVLYLGIVTVNGGLVLAGSPVNLQTLAQASPIQIDLNGGEQEVSTGRVIDGKQVFDINVTPYGYQPNYLKVQKNIPVKLNLNGKGAYNCALAFRIPSLGIAKNLRPTGSDSVEFTPTQTGKIVYTCSMGMYSGVIDVI